MPAKYYVIFACFFIYTCSNAEVFAPQKTPPQQPNQALKAKVYIGTYSIPTMLKTGKEKLGAKGGKLRIPELAIIKTETIKINGRQATKISFDILKTIQKNMDAALQRLTRSGQQGVEPFSMTNYYIDPNNNNATPIFTMQLDQQYLPGLDPRIWGPKSSTMNKNGNILQFTLEYQVVGQPNQ